MEQRNEPETERCHRCGKEILKGAHVCDACAHVIDCEQLEAMERNEPSTDVLALLLRKDATFTDNGMRSPDMTDTMRYAADRLESQERELLQKTQELEAAKTRHAKKDAESAELFEKAISRAEQAERERDAAVADIKRISENHSACHMCDILDAMGCCHKSSYCDGLSYFKLRGQPQEGEGKI